MHFFAILLAACRVSELLSPPSMQPKPSYFSWISAKSCPAKPRRPRVIKSFRCQKNANPGKINLITEKIFKSMLGVMYVVHDTIHSSRATPPRQSCGYKIDLRWVCARVPFKSLWILELSSQSWRHLHFNTYGGGHSSSQLQVG